MAVVTRQQGPADMRDGATRSDAPGTPLAGSARVVAITRAHMEAHVADYIAVSADVSPWTAQQFLRDLPGKWDLSFALWSDRPIGYCILSWRNGRIHINQFMVAPSARGCGCGAVMLGEAVARGARSLKVHPDNTGAIRFYRRHGWTEAGRENGYLLMTFGNG